MAIGPSTGAHASPTDTTELPASIPAAAPQADVAELPPASLIPIDPPQLIFVGCSLADCRLDRPELLDRVLHNVTETGPSLGADLSQLLVWRPTAAEMREIHTCAHNARRRDVIQAILRSLDQSTRPLGPPRAKAESSDDLLAAQSHLRAVLLKPESRAAARRRRLRAYQRAVDAALVTPPLQYAADTKDPRRRNRLTGLAVIVRLLHPAA